MNLRPIMQKEPRYENRRLLDLCQGAPCHLQYPGCTGGTSPDAPSVPCHDNRQEGGRGFAYKSHDHLAVPGCPSCHFQHDEGTTYTAEQKGEVMDRAQRKWLSGLLARGVIEIRVLRRAA